MLKLLSHIVKCAMVLDDYLVSAVWATYENYAGDEERDALAEYLEDWIYELGGDVNERTADGEPLLVYLMDAARSAKAPVEAIKVVLAAGADRSVRSTRLKTALRFAAHHGHAKVVALLQ